MRGRKPVPAEQRRLEGGDVSHRPLPEPVLIGGRPQGAELVEPPEHLPEGAQRFWREIVPMLAETGMLDRVDRHGLEMLSTSYWHWLACEAVVAEKGHFARGASGQIKEHPALKMAREYHQLYVRTCEHYGLTPLSRARLGLADVHRRSLEAEMAGVIGQPEWVDAEVVEESVGLPGV